MLPHDPQFDPQVEASEVVCSIERFELLAVTSLKESTKGKIVHWTLFISLDQPLRFGELASAITMSLLSLNIHQFFEAEKHIQQINLLL